MWYLFCWNFTLLNGNGNWCFLFEGKRKSLVWIHGYEFGCVVVMWTGRRQHRCDILVVVVFSLISGDKYWRISLEMSSDSRSRSRSRSRSPLDRKIRSDRFSYRDAPYRRESRRGFRFLILISYLYISFLMCVGWGRICRCVFFVMHSFYLILLGIFHSIINYYLVSYHYTHRFM